MRMLQLLAQGERSVQELADAATLNVTTASAHLQTLRELGLVASRRDRNQVIYRLGGDDVAALVAALVGVAEAHHAVVGQSLARDERVEPMSREGLLEAVAAGRVLVIDVRPAEEYAAGHLPGAVSLPIDELRRRLDEVPTDQEVVAYCRGRVCELSHDAVDLLRSRGIEARATEDGILEWRADGVDLVSTAPDHP